MLTLAGGAFGSRVLCAQSLESISKTRCYDHDEPKKQTRLDLY